MQMLRRLVRFCLGVEALGLFGSGSLLAAAIAGVRAHSAEEGDGMLLPLAVPSLVVVLNAIPAAAWWTLRAGKPSARLWVISASGFNLSVLALGLRVWMRTGNDHLLWVYAFCGVVGALGLVAFFRDAEALPPPVARMHSRIEGDGTSKWKEYVGAFVSIAIIWLGMHWEGEWAAVRGLAYPSFVAFVIQMELAILLSTLGHELGHFAAGWASGKVLRSFQIGPFRWSVRGGKWRFEFHARKFHGGAVGMVAASLKKLRSNLAFFIMGGPIASLLAGCVCLLLLLSSPGHFWGPYWMMLAMIANFSLAGFIANLIPQKPGNQYSDGAQLYQIVTNGPWARVHLALATVSSSLVTSLRPRDFDIEMLAVAAQSVPQGDRGLLLRLFACQHYLDRGGVPEGLAYLAEAETLYEQSTFASRSDICAEFAFLNAFYRRDAAAAAIWSQRMEAKRKMEMDADYWRARAAMRWLQGDREGAKDAWSKGVLLARDLPPYGAYDYTRACFERLREALEQPEGRKTMTAPFETEAAAS